MITRAFNLLCLLLKLLNSESLIRFSQYLETYVYKAHLFIYISNATPVVCKHCSFVIVIFSDKALKEEKKTDYYVILETQRRYNSEKRDAIAKQ